MARKATRKATRKAKAVAPSVQEEPKVKKMGGASTGAGRYANPPKSKVRPHLRSLGAGAK